MRFAEEVGNIPTFGLEDGVAETIGRIRVLLKTSTRPVIGLITGGTSSGKTKFVAEKVCAAFGDQALRLPMDDYYRGASFMKEEAARGNILNYDQPEAVDIPGVATDARSFLDGKPIRKRVYGWDGVSKITEELIWPKPVVIIEGIFALNEEIQALGDIRIFVDIGRHGQLLRRLLRDVVERGDQAPNGILRYFTGTVIPMHELHVQPSIRNADLIIRNEYDPFTEAWRSGTAEKQLKFKVPDIDTEKIRRTGSEFLGATEQIDKYRDLPDGRLGVTGESIRIREVNGKFIFGYKGPRAKSDCRKRPKFEFEIDKATKDQLSGLYTRLTQTVIKSPRLLYGMDSFIFSVDEVYCRYGNGPRTFLGKFLEIRVGNDPRSYEAVDRFLDSLGLERKDAILMAYSEM
ncbi:MAG: CYTH domain-containing protein [Candidatus Moranbacteria bacterium]|nr:CYTH domain-containing protein [Candidatus Moranbacteria bacterium]